MPLVLAVACGVSPAKMVRRYDLDPLPDAVGRRFRLRLPMDDGVELDTHVQLPASEGPYAVVVYRVPYPLDGILRDRCRLLAAYGWACVWQKTRGQGRSDGEWEPFVHEPADGRALLRWVAEQPWNRGDVALMGESYLAAVQWAVVGQPGAEQVRTLVPTDFGADPYLNLYEHGLFRHEIATAWMVLNPDRRFRPFAGRRLDEALATRPRTAMDVAAADVELPWFRTWLAAADRSHPFLQQEDSRLLATAPERIDVPVLLLGGWADAFSGGLLDTWDRLATRDRSTLVVGPWDHLGAVASDRPLPNVEGAIGLDGSVLQTKRVIDWLKVHLDGAEPTLPVGAAITYVPGLDDWVVRDDWPPPTDPVAWFPDVGDAVHCAAPTRPTPLAEGSARWVHDPADPAPSAPGGAGSLAGALPTLPGVSPGLRDQGTLCAERDDVLGWLTEPLTEPLHVAGPLSATLDVASTAPDSAVGLRVAEVRPDGSVWQIREGYRVLTLRDGDAQRVAYRPGERVRVSIDTWPIEHRLEAGSRILFQVASASWPKLEAHPNRAEPWAEVTDPQPAEQTLFLDATRFTLPVVAR